MNFILGILYSIVDFYTTWVAVNERPKSKFWGSLHKWTSRLIVVGAVISIIYLTYLWFTL